jgi:F420-non-reducing hydrogenase large subunit
VEYESYKDFFGGVPVHATFAYHWARIIEMLTAAEKAAESIRDPELMEGPLRSELGAPGEGVGVIEAARGTLIHHYQLDEKGIVTGANLVVATTHNIAGISVSIKEMARSVIHKGKVDQGILNRIEMSLRNYDPCLACATHALPGQMPLMVNVRDPSGEVIEQIVREEP